MLALDFVPHLNRGLVLAITFSFLRTTPLHVDITEQCALVQTNEAIALALQFPVVRRDVVHCKPYSNIPDDREKQPNAQKDHAILIAAKERASTWQDGAVAVIDH